MAGEADDLVTRLDRGSCRVPRDERRGEHCELRVARAGELFGRRVEQERGERGAEGVLGRVDDRPGRVTLPGASHTGSLSALSGKDDGNPQDDDFLSRLVVAVGAR